MWLNNAARQPSSQNFIKLGRMIITPSFFGEACVVFSTSVFWALSLLKLFILCYFHAVTEELFWQFATVAFILSVTDWLWLRKIGHWLFNLGLETLEVSGFFAADFQYISLLFTALVMGAFSSWGRGDSSPFFHLSSPCFFEATLGKSLRISLPHKFSWVFFEMCVVLPLGYSS